MKLYKARKTKVMNVDSYPTLCADKLFNKTMSMTNLHYYVV